MPYWRLSSFYFFYFALLGALVPYWGLLLQFRGFNAIEIGQLMAILMATKMVAPNLWGWLGDHLARRMRIVQIASAISAFVFIGMFYADSFWSIAIAMSLYSFFWNASLPQFEVVTLSYLKERVARYAQIRAWGSVGFIVIVILLGILIDFNGPEIILPVVMLIFLGIWLSSLFIKDPAPEAYEVKQESLISVLKKPAVIGFFIAVFLMQMGHGPYYAFYSIYMEDNGYTKSLIGQFWALGVVAEVVVFIVMHRLLARWGARLVLVTSLLLAALRWTMIAYLVDSLAALLFAQLLHAATFGTFHAAGIHLVQYYFRGSLQGRGQALYASVSFGAGGALGSLLSGVSWQNYGSNTTFVAAAVISLLAAAVAWKMIDNQAI